MSRLIHTLLLEEIDRTLYECLRLELVSLGYLPDIVQFNTENDYLKAKKDIEDGKGFVVELHGVGSTEVRDAVQVCNVTLDRKGIPAGSLGGGTFQYIPNSNGKFDKEQIPSMSSNVTYEVRVLSNSTKSERIITEMLLRVFGHRVYIPVLQQYNPDKKKNFLLISQGSVNVTATNLLERVFTFVVPDVWLGKSALIEEIPPLTSVHFWTYVQNFSGEVENKADLIVQKK